MMLKYLELRNYRKFERVQLELPDGIIGILGDNGVGKSTLVESICWALFGNQKEIVRVGKDSIRKNDVSPQEQTYVKVEFQFAGDEYIVTREMTGKSHTTDAKLIGNGKIIATGVRDVTRFIEAKLGMDYKSFFISVFARQKELNALSSLTEGERRKTIVRMLGIDKLDDLIENIGRNERIFRERISDFRNLIIDEDGQPKEQRLKEEQKELEKKKEDVFEEISILREKQEDLKERENSLEEQSRKISDKLRSLREAENKLNLERTALASLRREYQQLEKNMDESEKASNEIKKLDQLNRELSDLKRENDRLLSLKTDHDRIEKMRDELKSVDEEIHSQDDELKKANAVSNELVNVINRIKETERMMRETENELQNLGKTHVKLEEQLMNLNRSIDSDNNHLMQIEELGPESKCPTCERVLGEHYTGLKEKLASSVRDGKNRVEELQISVQEIGAQVTDRSNKLEALRKRQEASRRDEKSLAKAEKSIEIAIKSRETLNNKRKKLLSDIDNLGKIEFDPGKLEGMENRLNDINENRERLIALSSIADKRQEYEKSFRQTQSEIEERENRISDNLVDSEEIERTEKSSRDVERERVELRNRSEEIYESILQKTTQKESIASDMNVIRREQESIVEIRKQLSAIDRDLSDTSKLIGIMKDFRRDLISRIIPTLSQVASELIRDLTGGKYASLTLDDGYNIFLEDNGEIHRLERFSGGEIDLANLCLRLAISKVISERAGNAGVNLLVLDEIFGSQDASRKRNLLTAFNALSKQFGQIFLITHIEDVKDSLSAILEVYEDERGTSHIRAST